MHCVTLINMNYDKKVHAFYLYYSIIIYMLHLHSCLLKINILINKINIYNRIFSCIHIAENKQRNEVSAISEIIFCKFPSLFLLGTSF